MKRNCKKAQASKRAQHTRTTFLSCASKRSQHAKRGFLSCAFKKAQLQQMFIYVSAILVIGFIVLFGYRMIAKVLDQKCSVEEQDFMVDIIEIMDQNVRDGSRDYGRLPTVCNYDTICFVNASAMGDINWDANLAGYTKIDTSVIQANTQDNISYNVYLYKSGIRNETLPISFDERINVKDGSGLLCIKSSAGSFRFTVEGLGKKGVILSPAS